jgi:hypothetical protein
MKARRLIGVALLVSAIEGGKGDRVLYLGSALPGGRKEGEIKDKERRKGDRVPYLGSALPNNGAGCAAFFL